jgi:SAM-dependent methyltransferase
MVPNAHYTREQAFWDAKGVDDYATLSAYDRERVADWIGWQGHGRVLDIGGGSGMISRLIGGKPNTEIVCLDVSHAMLTHCPVSGVQADAVKLPFANESFDLIVAAAFMHHLPDTFRQVVFQSYSVLRHGGRIVGYDPNGHCIQNRVFMGDGRFRLASFSPEERPIKPEEMQARFGAAKFYDFEYQYLTFRNETRTKFEQAQRLLNPLAHGPLRKYLDRWYFWQATKA